MDFFNICKRGYGRYSSFAKKYRNHSAILHGIIGGILSSYSVMNSKFVDSSKLPLTDSILIVTYNISYVSLATFLSSFIGYYYYLSYPIFGISVFSIGSGIGCYSIYERFKN